MPLEEDEYLISANGNRFLYYFQTLIKNGRSLLVHSNRIFQLILHSGQRKRFLVNQTHFAFIETFFLLVDTIHEIKCRPIFKEHYSYLLKPFYWIFTDIPASGSSFFRLVETEFSSTPSSRQVDTNFELISNRVLLFRAFFFCCWKALLKLRVNQFSSIFSVPNSGSSFPDQLKQIFYRMLFQRVETDFFSKVLLFRENFLLVETIIQIKVKPFLIE